MKGAFRPSMAWLHTWAALVVGWILFFMFLTGTLGYFDTEIDRWMQPERPLTVAHVSTAEAVDVGLRRLRDLAPGAAQWSVLPPNGRERLDLRIRWRADIDGAARRGSVTLDPTTWEPAAYRETGGGQLLYRMHYDLHYMPVVVARWASGICAMLMFAAIVTGVITHKKIFSDFFTLRWGSGQRSWLDLHNALGVMALPFHLMITYTGLVFIAYLYVSPIIAASYGAGLANRNVFIAEMFAVSAPRPEIEPAGRAAPLAPIAPLVSEAERRWGKGQVREIDIYHPGDANARISMTVGPLTPSRHHGELLFDGVSGELLSHSEDPPRSAPKIAVDTLLALHEGLFAGPVLRWLYFLSSLMGTAMIGAGLVLWTAKRRAKIGETFGFKLVERLNIGTIAGLPVAIAAYFWANRLIPVDFAGRAAWEAHAMFIVWAALLLHPIFRPAPRAWIEQLWLAAAAFGLLPLLNVLTTDRHLGVTLAAGVWELAGFDLTVLAVGLAFALASWRIGRRSHALPVSPEQEAAR